MITNRYPEFIKLAIPTNDGDTIFKGMLGKADYFYIYEINKNSYCLLEKRLNPYAKMLQRQKTLDVYEVLKDCSVIISSKIGKKGIDRLKERHIKLIFEIGRIEDILDKTIENNSLFNNNTK